jgi:glycosyltransferase involved in cell wall biosynthesis
MGRVPAERMPQVYRDNDIFLMSSAHEGMSNAMLEAMASGLPIITTECEGAEELITDNGIVVEEAEPAAIAEAIKRLANDRENYTETSIAARKRAKKFGWKSVAEEYLNCYDEILNRRPRRQNEHQD